MADERVADACRPPRMPPLRWLCHWLLQQARSHGNQSAHTPRLPAHTSPVSVACMYHGDIARALGYV